jgi:hypothetical protein
MSAFGSRPWQAYEFAVRDSDGRLVAETFSLTLGKLISEAVNAYPPSPAEPARLLAEAEEQIARLRAERDSEREGRQKCEAALRDKDKAMGVLFDRLSAAGVDCSDLIP